MKKIIASFALLIVVLALIIGAFFITGKDDGVPKYCTGEEAKQTFTYTDLVNIPMQSNGNYPVVYESEGMFDFSSSVLFEADPSWVERFVCDYKLVPSSESPVLFNLTNNFRALKLDYIADMMDSDAWRHYTNGIVRYKRNSDERKGCFEAFINTSGNRVMIHYHSFGKEAEAQDQGKPL